MSYVDRDIAACVEVASLNGDPGTARKGPLRWLDTGEVWSLQKRGNKHTRNINHMFYCIIFIRRQRYLAEKESDLRRIIEMTKE